MIGPVDVLAGGIKGVVAASAAAVILDRDVFVVVLVMLVVFVAEAERLREDAGVWKEPLDKEVMDDKAEVDGGPCRRHLCLCHP